MDDERLKNPKKMGDDYFDELLERIRDIRASEKSYQKIKGIYSLSVDYNPTMEGTKDFLQVSKINCYMSYRTNNSRINFLKSG